MKKLLLLFLLVAGGVSTASATNYTVYFRPSADWKSANAKFALYMFNNSNDTHKTVDFSSSDISGVYTATFESDYKDGVLILRVDPNATGSAGTGDGYGWKDQGKGWWAQTGDLSAPTSNVYYVMTGAIAWSTDITTYTPTSKTFTINNFDCNADILPNFMDANSSEDNNLTSNGDFTYSRTVSGNVIRKGTYGFKLSDGTNTYDDGGSAWAVSGISTTNDAEYNITYSYNFISGVASATAEDTENSVSITEKYVIAGNEALTGYDWDWSGDHNVLDVSEGTGTLSLNNKSINAGSYQFKSALLLCNGGTKYKTFYESGENHQFDLCRNSIWNVNFSCNTSTLSSSSSGFSEVAGYFIYGGHGGWSLGQRMTESDGVYTATISNPGYAFAIVPTSNLSMSNEMLNNDWSKVIRPYKDSDSRTDIGFANYSGSTVAEDSGKGWQITSDNDADVTITYTPGTPGTWSITCADMEVPISAAGYATYSNSYKYQIANTNVEDVYVVSAINGGSVTLTSKKGSTFPAGEGVIIKGSGTVTINAVASDATATTIGSNFLVGSGNSTATPGEDSNYYVFSWFDEDPATVGFYLASNGSTEDERTLAAHKAYLNLGKSVEARPFLAFDFDDNEATGINNLTPVFNEGVAYDLQGRRVAQPTKGLYIVNGKKVIR